MSTSGGSEQTGTGYLSTAETHIGALVFAGDRVYKLKKPVDLGFVDFRDRKTRLWACRRELELNRRLAPDVYLDVLDVGPPGHEPCDHLVLMRRMPADRSLAALVEAGTPVEDEVREVAKKLAGFHSCAERGDEIAAEGAPDAVAGRWNTNVDGLRSFGGDLLDEQLLDEIAEHGRVFLEGRAPLLNRRVAEGRIVDGHGDVLSEDVFCLDDGPRILDCIEFDDRLRRLDAVDDAVCLAMDLEYRGAPELAERFLDWYAQFSDDAVPPGLRHFYTAYRALVRTKVACAKHSPGDEEAASDAREHLALAADHIRRAVPRLVLVGGLPGSGKTTLSERIADRLGAVLLSSDRVRKEIADLSPAEPAPAEYRSGLYSAEHTERTYDELVRRSGELLGYGESVVLDASWTREHHRERAVEAANQARAIVVPLRCQAPESTTVERLRGRHATASDADEEVARSIASDADDWPSAWPIDTTGSPEDSADEAVAVIADPQRST